MWIVPILVNVCVFGMTLLAEVLLDPAPGTVRKNGFMKVCVVVKQLLSFPCHENLIA